MTVTGVGAGTVRAIDHTVLNTGDKSPLFGLNCDQNYYSVTFNFSIHAQCLRAWPNVRVQNDLRNVALKAILSTYYIAKLRSASDPTGELTALPRPSS